VSDVVHLMSPRPGRIILSVQVDVPRPRKYSEVVTSPHFNELKSRLLATLGKES
jgi:NitT/TauT family transport system ATP-binding protein